MSMMSSSDYDMNLMPPADFGEKKYDSDEGKEAKEPNEERIPN